MYTKKVYVCPSFFVTAYLLEIYIVNIDLIYCDLNQTRYIFGFINAQEEFIG